MKEITGKKIEDLLSLLEINIQQQSAHKSDILAAVEAQIKTTVNGKIDKIASHLGEQDKLLKEVGETLKGIQDEQGRVKEELKRLKTDTDPVIEIQKTSKSLGKFFLWLGGICGALWTILKLIKL